jgi:predicted short-subunit dehydrogenase-like oxidoreductase (DUF2520 family)
MASTLNVIGGGRAGRTLARIWAHSGTFVLGDVLDAIPAVAASAVAFINSGRAVEALSSMRAADVWMLTPPDDQILACGKALAASGLLQRGNVVFHCSGASPSRDLAAVIASGIAVASVHPLKSFADPLFASQTFGGTYCAAEGDAGALAVLRPAFEAAGARVAEIDPEFKPIYHAASVLVCNYLPALIETGLRAYEKSGFERKEALRMIEPLVRETLDNVFRLGTAGALTGPIARGDHDLVARQAAALAEWNGEAAAIYRQLGAVAVELAQVEGHVAPDALAAIARTLGRKP